MDNERLECTLCGGPLPEAKEGSYLHCADCGSSYTVERLEGCPRLRVEHAPTWRAARREAQQHLAVASSDVEVLQRKVRNLRFLLLASIAVGALLVPLGLGLLKWARDTRLGGEGSADALFGARAGDAQERRRAVSAMLGAALIPVGVLLPFLAPRRKLRSTRGYLEAARLQRGRWRGVVERLARRPSPHGGTQGSECEGT